MSDASGNDAISYEAARDELLEVVRQLEAGGLTLEKSLALWERGEQLAVICQSWLDGAKDRLAARRPGTEGAASAAAGDRGDSGGSGDSD
ncbi:MAG: exodeoxyribonuclease small subunit [Actinomycetota bacterium]|jgi:exodeoxyribonuclease VII small subunit|nr:exodeoxyribonuclease small subunit [Actinomycetota bacterium]